MEIEDYCTHLVSKRGLKMLQSLLVASLYSEYSTIHKVLTNFFIEVSTYFLAEGFQLDQHRE